MAAPRRRTGASRFSVGRATRARRGTSAASRFTSGAATPSWSSSGWPEAITASSFCSAGVLWRSRPGSRRVVSASAARCVAVWVVTRAPCRSSRFSSSGRRASSRATTPVASTVAPSSSRWRWRVPIVRRASASDGFIRRRIAFMSSPRPAVPMPSIENSTVARWLVGVFQTSNRSVRLTGWVVRSTGTVGAWPPRGRSAGAAGVPGSQST